MRAKSFLSREVSGATLVTCVAAAPGRIVPPRPPHTPPRRSAFASYYLPTPAMLSVSVRTSSVAFTDSGQAARYRFVRLSKRSRRTCRLPARVVRVMLRRRRQGLGELVWWWSAASHSLHSRDRM